MVTMDLTRLQFLRELAARGTMTAAAEALNYTPSAVSQQLSTLEKELGIDLLERRGRTVALTPAGKALVLESDAVFAAAERATSAVEAVAGRVTGPVRIGAFQSAGARIVPGSVASLRASHPELEVHFTQWFTHGLRELDLGHLDICLDQSYNVLPHRRHRNFETHDLLDEPVLLAVHEDQDLGPKLTDYAEHTWAAADASHECGQLTRVVCGAHGFDPIVRFHTDDLEVSLQLVAAGLCVSLLPRLATYRLPEGVVLHPLDDVTRNVVALTRPGSAERPAIRVVLNHLIDVGATICC